jgi:hypothetical protein
VEYRLNTNASNVMKSRRGRSLIGDSVKEES